MKIVHLVDAQPFNAKYRGTCGGCGTYIYPGDRVHYIDKVLHLLNCGVCTQACNTENLPAPCTTCWIIPSLSGVCGCDE